MNVDGRLRTLGRRRLRPQARRVREDRGHRAAEPRPRGRAAAQLDARRWGPRPTATGEPSGPQDYSPDVTGEITDRTWSPSSGGRRSRSSSGGRPIAPHREDVATTLMGRPGPDPRPAPRYDGEEQALQAAAAAELQRGGHQRQADQRAHAAAPAQRRSRSRSCSSTTRGGRARCSPSTTTSSSWSSTLRKTNQLENTLIVFMSDNGWMQGEHRIPGDKFLPYEESLRVPFIMRGPGRARRQDGSRARWPTSTSRRRCSTSPTREAGRRDRRHLAAADRCATRKRRPDAPWRSRRSRPLFEGDFPGVNEWDRPYQRRAHRPLHVRRLHRDRRRGALRPPPGPRRSCATSPAIRAYARVKSQLAREARQARRLQGPLLQGRAVRRSVAGLAVAIAARRCSPRRQHPPLRRAACAGPARRALLRDLRAQGRAADATRHGLEHDRPQRCPAAWWKAVRRRPRSRGSSG